jgi:hypothetical protein
MSYNPQPNALRTQGYAGSVNDMVYAWLVDNGAANAQLNDMWMDVLEQQGYSSGSLDDRLNAFTTDLGYSGSLSDKMYKFWADGGVIQLPSLAFRGDTYVSLKYNERSAHREFTVSFWWKKGVDEHYHDVFQAYNNDASATAQKIWIRIENQATNPHIWCQTGSSGATNLGSLEWILTGAETGWNHILITREDDTVTATMKCYLNGVEISENPGYASRVVPVTGSINTGNGYFFLFGAKSVTPWRSRGAYRQFFWSETPTTASQVSNFYNSGFVGYGADGSNPLGVQPHLYIHATPTEFNDTSGIQGSIIDLGNSPEIRGRGADWEWGVDNLAYFPQTQICTGLVSEMTLLNLTDGVDVDEVTHFPNIHGQALALSTTVASPAPEEGFRINTTPDTAQPDKPFNFTFFLFRSSIVTTPTITIRLFTDGQTTRTDYLEYVYDFDLEAPGIGMFTLTVSPGMGDWSLPIVDGVYDVATANEQWAPSNVSISANGTFTTTKSSGIDQIEVVFDALDNFAQPGDWTAWRKLGLVEITHGWTHTPVVIFNNDDGHQNWVTMDGSYTAPYDSYSMHDYMAAANNGYYDIYWDMAMHGTEIGTNDKIRTTEVETLRDDGRTRLTIHGGPSMTTDVQNAIDISFTAVDTWAVGDTLWNLPSSPTVTAPIEAVHTDDSGTTIGLLLGTISGGSFGDGSFLYSNTGSLGVAGSASRPVTAADFQRELDNERDAILAYHDDLVNFTDQDVYVYPQGGYMNALSNQSFKLRAALIANGYTVARSTTGYAHAPYPTLTTGSPTPSADPIEFGYDLLSAPATNIEREDDFSNNNSANDYTNYLENYVPLVGGMHWFYGHKIATQTASRTTSTLPVNHAYDFIDALGPAIDEFKLRSMNIYTYRRILLREGDLEMATLQYIQTIYEP